MPHIDNYKEKRLLIANYFYGKTRKELCPGEVFDMWRNWFKEDFLVNGKPIYKIKNGELERVKNVSKKYFHTFDSTYTWIKKSVENKNNSTTYFRSELDRVRKRGFAEILSLAKPLGFYVKLSEKNLYKNKLGNYHLIKNNETVTSGDCDKIIKYLKEYKKA